MKTTKSEVVAPRKARSPKAEAPTPVGGAINREASLLSQRTTKAEAAAIVANAFAEPTPEPTAPAPKAPATKLAPQDTLVIVKVVDARTTVQRSAKGFGKAWRQNGRTGTSLRHIALQAIASVADEDGTVAYADAVKALTGLDLGCSSPATRISKLLRSGHLELQA